MKILYLSDSEVPSTSANSVHVMKMCEALVRFGNEVSLHCYQRIPNSADIFRYYGITDSFALLPSFESRIPVLRRILRMASAMRVSRRAVFDLLYCRDLYSASAALGNADIIYEAHVPPSTRIETVLLRRILLDARCKALVVISDALRRKYIDTFAELAQSKIIVAHDAGDIETPLEDSELVVLPGRSSTIQIGYVGSLLPGKGAEVLAQLAGRLPDFDFHIVGGMPHEVTKLAQGHSVSNLFLHGHVPHRLVQHYLGHFDIVLFPMANRVLRRDGVDIANWTSPLKLFEYMAAAKAIVASDLPSIREILVHEETAILVPWNSIEAWAEAIRRLVATPGLRAKIARNAFSRYSEHHTWNARVDLLLRPTYVKLGD